MMRKVMLTAATLVGTAIAGMVGTAPAAAYDYPWCVQGRGVGYPGECAYQTYRQCQASASGRNVSCDINPLVAFDRARRGEPVYADAPPMPASLPRARHHHHRTYSY
jgi:Protein of unknown function (DUF3551)